LLHVRNTPFFRSDAVPHIPKTMQRKIKVKKVAGTLVPKINAETVIKLGFALE
jgi:hypothetical protein